MRKVVLFLIALVAWQASAEVRLYEGEMRIVEREGKKCSPAYRDKRAVSLVLTTDAEGREFGLALMGSRELPPLEVRGDITKGYANLPAGNPPRSTQFLNVSAMSADRLVGEFVQPASTSPECRARRAELELVRVVSIERALDHIAELQVGIAAMASLSKASAAFNRRDFDAANEALDAALATTERKPYLLFVRRQLALWKYSILRAQQKERDGVLFTRKIYDEFEAAFGQSHPLTSLTLVTLAQAEAEAGLPEATRTAERALELASRLHGPKHPETIDARWAVAVANRFKNPDRALAVLEDVIPVVESTYGLTSLQANSIVTPAIMFAAGAGYLHKAMVWSNQLITAFEQSPGGIHSAPFHVLTSSAATLAMLGRYGAASERALQALSVAEKNPSSNARELLFAYELAAILEIEKKNYAAAFRIIERELAIIERQGGESNPSMGVALHLLGTAKRKSGDARAAIGILSRAERLLAEIGAAGARARIAAMVERGIALGALNEFDEARTAIRRAAELAAQSGTAASDNRVNGGWFEYFKAKGAMEAAIFFGKLQIAYSQETRRRSAGLSVDLRASLAEAVAPEYREVADLLVRQGRLPEAQAILALLKEDELYEYSSRDLRVTAMEAAVDLTRTEAVTRQALQLPRDRIAALGAELETIRARSRGAPALADEKRREEIAGELRRANVAFLSALDGVIEEFAKAPAERNREIGEKNLLALKSLQGTLRELGEGTVAIHYVASSQRLHAILTTPSVQLVRSTPVTEAELNRLTFALRQRLANPRLDAVTAARALHRVLIAPIAEELEQAGAKSLLVSLDGTLRYVPLAALHDGKRFLIQQFRVSILTDAARGSLKDQPAANWSISGLGVTKGFPGFVALPSVRDELESIVRVGDRGVIPGERFFDEEFDLKRLRSMLDRNRPVLHIASHFVFQPGTEDDSYLLLGNGDRLSLRAMREEGLDFNGLDLLTLSACDTGTGGGKDGNGREIEGFGALAQRQGAKSVLATLWPVADESTAILMRRLYQIRESSAIGKAEALRRAQLELLADTRYAHPFFWAPFILMGNAL